MIQYKPMAKYNERMQALRLRKMGKSVRDIAHTLDVSRGSVSVWCRDIVLTKAQREKLTREQILAGNKGRMIGAEINRQKRLRSIREQELVAHTMIGRLSKRDKLILGIGLYWGEGVKAVGSATAFVNSDPQSILFMKDWFESLGVASSQFSPRVYISKHHEERQGAIIRFWSQLLKIPSRQFGRVVLLHGRPKKVYENHNSYYGVLSLGVRRGSTLKYRILGLIKECNKAGVAQLVRARHS